MQAGGRMDRRTDKWMDGQDEGNRCFCNYISTPKIKNQSCGDTDHDLKLKQKINPKMKA
jgi:hypothetical protein